MARSGLRVLAVATRALTERPAEVTAESVETGLTFLGLVGPPRSAARRGGEAVRVCQAAGIRVVMITGDHPATAAGRSPGMLGIADGGDPSS